MTSPPVLLTNGPILPLPLPLALVISSDQERMIANQVGRRSIGRIDFETSRNEVDRVLEQGPRLVSPI